MKKRRGGNVKKTVRTNDGDKNDDDGGGAQKTKEGKERRNYDGISKVFNERRLILTKPEKEGGGGSGLLRG